MIPRIRQNDNPRLYKRLSDAEKLKLGITGGTGGGATTFDASAIVSGTMSPTRLGSGTANGTTVLYGNNTWAAPPGAGSGTPVGVDGAAALASADLNSTTPAAPAGSLNVDFQVSGTSVSAFTKTDNASLEISASAIRRAALTGDVTASAGANATTIKNDVALAGNPTTTTQAANNNSTRIATTAYVNNVATGSNTGDVSLAGTPTYITIAGQTITRGNVDLTNSVTGDLPLSNLAQASGVSVLLGRGSAAGAGDFQEITLGSGLTMTGTSLAAGGGSGDVVGDDVSTTDQNIVAYVSTGGKHITELTGTQGDVLYHNGTSWTKLGASSVVGQSLTTRGSGANPTWGGMIPLKKSSNQVINGGAGTFVDIGELTFPVTSGVDYAFFFYIVFQSLATTTGWKAGVNGPGGTLSFWMDESTIANATSGAATHLHRHNTATDDMVLLTSTVTASVDLVVMIHGRYSASSSGTFAARFANELAANTDVSVRQGSWGYYF